MRTMSQDPATKRSRRTAPLHRIRMSLAVAAHDVVAAATAPAGAGPPPRPRSSALRNAQTLGGILSSTTALPGCWRASGGLGGPSRPPIPLSPRFSARCAAAADGVGELVHDRNRHVPAH